MADLLEDLGGLVPFITTPGSKGYHVQVPLDGSVDFHSARDFARTTAGVLAERDPVT